MDAEEDTFTSFSAAANATVTKTLSFATSQILQVNINGVVLKSTQYSISGTTLTIPPNAIPYVIETTGTQEYRFTSTEFVERFSSAYGQAAASEIAAHLPK